MKAIMALARQLVTVLCVGAAAAIAQSGALRAGAAKVDITPTAEMFPLKDMRIYGSVHDPIFARALVLDNGVSKVALVSLDMVHFPEGDGTIEAVSKELGIAADHVLVNATHDHNSPGIWGKSGTPYTAVLRKGLIAAVREANANLQPATVGYGTGKAYVNTNRDEKIGEGYHMGYDPEGPSDKTVAVMVVKRANGEVMAVYSNYAVHSVVMFLAKTKDGMEQITGDLAGTASAYVEDHFKGAVALWTMGAAGDQNPLFMATYNQDAPDVHDEGAAGYALQDVLARRVGQEIVRVTRAVENTTGKSVLWGAESSVTCPGQQRAEPPVAGVPQAGYRAPAHIRMVDSDPVTIPLHLIMVNDVALAGVSGEVFTEIGQHVKRESLFDRTMMVTMLPNGIGYIPTDKGYLMPSEKAITNRIKPGCAEPAMVEVFRKMEEKYLPVWEGAGR